MNRKTNAAAANASTTGRASKTRGNRGSRGRASGVHCKDKKCGFEKVLPIPSNQLPSSATQFVTDPKPVEMPQLGHGLTSFYKVDGQPAKLSDVKDPDTGGSNPRPVYRILPGTHKHVTNYVVVTEEDAKKFRNNDPATVLRVFKSQQMAIKKHFAGLTGTEQGNAMPTAPVPSASSLATENSNITAKRTPVTVEAAAATPSSAVQRAVKSKRQNLKITTVPGGGKVTGSRVTAAAAPRAAPVLPLVTPVPMVNPPSSPPPTVTPAPAQPTDSDTVASRLEKMHLDLEQLKAQVAQLLKVRQEEKE